MTTILGESDFGGFYIVDSRYDEDSMLDSMCNPIEEWNYEVCYRISSRGISLRTSNKAVLYKMEFEILPKRPITNEFAEWSEVAESSLKVDSDTLVVFAVPDGGLDDYHGLISIKRGSYVLRIHFKSRYEIHEDLDSIDIHDVEDQFKVQAWLDDLIPTTVLYSRSNFT